MSGLVNVKQHLKLDGSPSIYLSSYFCWLRVFFWMDGKMVCSVSALVSRSHAMCCGFESFCETFSMDCFKTLHPQFYLPPFDKKAVLCG